MHLSYGWSWEKGWIAVGESHFSFKGSRYSLLTETEYWMNRVCVLSWNGEIDVSMFGGMLGMLCVPHSSPIPAKLLNTVHWLILLLKTFKGDNFRRSSEKLGLKSAVVSHPHTHFCSLACKGCLVQQSHQSTRSSHLPLMVNKVLQSSDKIKSLIVKDQKLQLQYFPGRKQEGLKPLSSFKKYCRVVADKVRGFPSDL